MRSSNDDDSEVDGHVVVAVVVLQVVVSRPKCDVDDDETTLVEDGPINADVVDQQRMTVRGSVTLGMTAIVPTNLLSIPLSVRFLLW